MFDFSKMTGASGDAEETFGLDWSEDAKERIRKVPAGFMRNMTISRVEASATKSSLGLIELEFLEKELSDSASMMQSMMGKGSVKPGNVNTASASKEKPASADIYYCKICGFTLENSQGHGCPNCKSSQEKLVKLSEEEKADMVTPVSGQSLEWDREALSELDGVPSGFMRDLTKWRIERFARACGAAVVTGTVFEKKYKEWQETSSNCIIEMPWDEDAVLKVARIPSFVRGVIQKEVEKYARSKDAPSVTSRMLLEIGERLESGMNFHKS